jgi:hypothetical protein
MKAVSFGRRIGVAVVLAVGRAAAAWAGSAAPQITSVDHAEFTAEQFGSFTITTTGSPTPAISLAGGYPPNLTFTDNGNGTATLAGTPTVGTAGGGDVTITASNGIAPDAVQTLHLLVYEKATIDGPLAATVVEGVPASVTIYSYGQPAPSLSLVGDLPQGLALESPSPGVLRLTGVPRFGSAGSYSGTLTATNSVGSSTAVFVLTVNPVSSIPTLQRLGGLLLLALLAMAGALALRHRGRQAR